MIGAGHWSSSPPHILRRSGSGHKQSFYLPDSSSSRYSDIQTFAPNTISCWLVVAGIRAAAGAGAPLPSNTSDVPRICGDIKSVQEYPRVSRSVQEYPGVSRSVQETLRVSRSVLGFWTLNSLRLFSAKSSRADRSCTGDTGRAAQCPMCYLLQRKKII